MMVGFSCFPTHISCHKTKKEDQQGFQECYSQELHKSSPVLSSDEPIKVTPVSATSILEMEESIPSNMHTNAKQITSPSSSECCWKSEEHNEISYPGNGKEFLWIMSPRKSQSVGSGLDREGRLSCNADTDDEIDQALPLNNFQDENFGGLVNSYGDSGLQEVCGSDDAGINLLNQNQENTFGINVDPLSNGSTFFVEAKKQFDCKFDQDGEDRFPDHVVELNHTSPPHTFSTCHSLPSLEVQGSSPVCRSMQHGSKSVENLCSLDMKTGYLDGGGIHSRMSVHQYRTASSRDIPQTSVAVGEGVHSVSGLREECVIFGANKEWEDTDFMTRCRNHIFNNKFNDDCASHNLNVSLDGWREPEIDGINHVNIKMEEMFGECHESNNRNFNIKRIEEWIRQIDIHESGIVQEVGESSSSIPKKKKDYHLITGVNASKLCAKGSGFEAAYNYISSLAPASTSAQMTSLGLVVIPFLSAFSCLKVLNLSCNAIVKITSGALPRGLHMLNLSRNNISTIEGLRELTRLRVLDLSYNRIVRIGHGLAACSSLKELYLAGNKIREVEGLHRLLKLNVLDLQFNKISTAKCLGQLAANYASLQVINLEGNPAQRNVGEEQLKRYLLSLLPHLAYFNKHIIRATSTKELSDRSNHSASSRQFDRGMRSDHKRSRRGNHTAVSHKMTSSSNHFRPGQAVGSSPKPSRHRERHVQHLPPVGSKIYHLPRIDSKLFSSLQPINPMRRSRSEGNF